jgi:hypothetical protein
MASLAVAVAPQTKGVAALSRPDSPSSVSSAKRKRPDGDEASPSIAGDDETKQHINGSESHRDEKELIRDYFNVLRKYVMMQQTTTTPISSPLGKLIAYSSLRFDTDGSVLNRTVPSGEVNGEPLSKRQKSEDPTAPSTIQGRVQQDRYKTLEDLVSDITLVVDAQVAAQKSSGSDGDDKVSSAIKFKDLAYQLYRRELAYPQIETPKAIKAGADRDGKPATALMIYSATSTGRRPLLTSMQRKSGADQDQDKSITQSSLPNGVYIAEMPSDVPHKDQPARSLTLGELFPSPRNLPPLQPHKPSKSTIKNNILTFYHPELTPQSKFHSGTYFAQHLSMGHWLDYSNATPSTHIKTKQRERAQSLAGVKPSSDELEMSEMEALFRGAFSSFAPCKDDTAAVVPSGQLSHMYWQQWGRRNFQRAIELETSDENGTSVDGQPDPSAPMELDDKLIEEAIAGWDDSAVDPSLSAAMGEKKANEDKEVDELLEEVSDLIETLASYQRNRNLTLPTSQDRHSTDPQNGDMLRNSSLSHQPNEEEMMTYQALKAQLSMIIQTLPPFAVARLNSDKLEELNVSTKIQIRTKEYRGVMDEDEPASRARHAAASQAPTPRASHRTPSVSTSVPYASPQYGAQQYGATARSPMPTTPHFPQTPVRTASHNMYQRPHSGVAVPQPQQRPMPQQPYRAPNGYGLAGQLAKSQTPYGHSNMAQYSAGVPNQPRMQPHQAYAGTPQGTSNHRYPQGYPGVYPQQQQPTPQQALAQAQMQPQQHYTPQHMQQQRQFTPYMNGAAPMPQQGMPQQVMPQQVVQPHMYNQSPTPPQQQQQMGRPAYGTPGQVPMAPSVRQISGGGQLMPQPQGNRSVGITGYHTVMGDAQQQQVIDQARQQLQARQDAQSRTIGFGKPQGEIAGLAGIGLSGNVDIHKLAAARANMAARTTNMSPSPKPMVGPVPTGSPMQAVINGVGAGPTPVASPMARPVSVRNAPPPSLGPRGFSPPPPF